MSFIFSLLLGIGVLVVLCCLGAGLFYYLQNRAVVSHGDGSEKNPFEQRLDELDRRLTDIQDVMIALSEKFDRWEAQSKSLT